MGLIAFGLIYLFNHIYPALYYALRSHHWPHDWLQRPYIKIWWHIGVIWLGTTVFLAFLIPLLFPKKLKPRQKRFKGPGSNDLDSSGTLPFGLWLGRSTGHLSRLWHRATLAPNLDIVLSAEDAAQNILVLGGIGAGKTTSQTKGDSTRAWTEPTSKHHSSTQSITESRESVLDATLFRNLTLNQAITLLSLQDHSMDDVLELMPLFRQLTCFLFF